MKKICLLVIAFVQGYYAFSQNNNGISFFGGSTQDLSICPSSASFAGTPQEVTDMITKMLKRIGQQNRYIILSCSTVDNCQAIFFNGKEYILYNPEFLRSVQRLKWSQSDLPIGGDDHDWDVMTVIAHELGHHINRHFINNDPALTSKKKELEADHTAGFIMYCMGATLQQTQHVYYTLQEQGTFDHPPRNERLDAVANGWREAQELRPVPPKDATDPGPRSEPTEPANDVVTVTQNDVNGSSNDDHTISYYDVEFKLENSSNQAVFVTIYQSYGYYRDCNSDPNNFVQEGEWYQIVKIEGNSSGYYTFHKSLSNVVRGRRKCSGVSGARYTASYTQN